LIVSAGAPDLLGAIREGRTATKSVPKFPAEGDESRASQEILVPLIGGIPQGGVRMKRKSGGVRSKAVTEDSALMRIVEYVIDTADPSRLFEFYYWCEEPDLLTIVRACAALPEAQRKVIASFFAAMDGNELISVSSQDDDRLVLCCQSGRLLAQSSAIVSHKEAKSRA
jgi:hypothetical protein